MGVLNKLQRLLGIIEGHEEELARTISNRTSVSQAQVRKGLEKAQELANDRPTDGNS